MFAIETSGVRKIKHRLVAGTILKKSDFKRVTARLGLSGVRARKVAFVAARTARRREDVATYWNGRETTNTARAGDFIVTTLTRRRTVLRDKRGNPNQYVIKARTFRKLYGPAPGKNRFGKFFQSKSIVTAIYLSGGFDIIAPWGQRERAPKGYLMLNGNEVYGNNAETFEATYELLT
ncbi:MAG: hypothetical protein J2P54_07570 [Bradyrhizobiaceae bacterium]|nr:hypothetical protein [Bradyrhizobiaceae bacterium]